MGDNDLAVANISGWMKAMILGGRERKRDCSLFITLIVATV